MGALYDLLETYRIQNDPRFAYEGLYQDPMKPTNVLDPNYNSFTYNPDSPSYGYSTMYADNLQPFMSSSFPQEFGVGSLFNPRVGRPEQSIYYNEPSLNAPQDFYQPIGDPFQTDYPITRDMQPAPTSLGFDTSYGVANEEDEEQVESLVEEKPKGIAKLFDVLRNIPTPMNLIRSIGENFGKAPTYSRFSPGGTFRGGIYSIDGVNTPIRLVNDFYNRTTGLNRFDRARNRFNQTRSLKDLFAASRTLSEFNNARNILNAQKKSGYTSNFMNRPKSERNYTGPSGGDNTGGDKGAKGAADSFSNRSGMGRTGY